LLQISPRPLPSENTRFYPKEYWFTSQQEFAGRLEEAYRRLVLMDHVRFVARALKSCESRDGIVLDVGCGGGLFLSLLARRGYRVVGVDSSVDAASAAWRHNSVPVVCGDLSQPPFPEGSCTAITMFHVLEHVYDPGSYLVSARSLLHPAGRLVVQVPNAGSWQFKILGSRWTGIDVPRHLFNFRDTDITALLERNGFEVVRSKYFSLRDNPAGLATSLAPALDPMVRRVLRKRESRGSRLAKDLLYLGLVLAGVPLTLLEAGFRAGSTIMLEARKKP
jgi:SAM-dependent methyltransferase